MPAHTHRARAFAHSISSQVENPVPLHLTVFYCEPPDAVCVVEGSSAGSRPPAVTLISLPPQRIMQRAMHFLRGNRQFVDAHTYRIETDTGPTRLLTQRPHTDFETVADFLNHHIHGICAALSGDTHIVTPDGIDIFDVFLLIQRFDTKTEKYAYLKCMPGDLDIPF